MNNGLIVDDNKQQLIDYYSHEFMYQNAAATFTTSNSVIWHWHDALEFVHTLNGESIFHLPHQDIHVPADSILLLNSGISHSAGTADVKVPVKFHTHLISPTLLSGDTGSTIKSKYFDPVTKCINLPYYLILPDSPRHALAKNLFEVAYKAAEQQDFMFELVIRQNLTQIWMMFIQDTKEIWHNAAPVNDVRGDCLKQMLAFVQRNCTEKLTLEQIAASAGISTRECSRCFQSILKMTPIEYLTDCRVRKAADMLQNTSQSIIEISYNCGFSTASYFCRIFKKVMGQSPSNYKRQYRNSKT